MPFDLDSLLAPVPGASPCGPNLEYDPEYVALLLAARGKPGQELGGHVIAPEPPDWRAVRSQAGALLARTKDVRLALLLLRALVRTEHLSGLRDGLAVLDRLLERYWDCVHPQAEPEQAGGATARLNALAALTDPAGLLADVRHALVVAAGPHGRVAVRDILRAAGVQQGPAAEAGPGPGEIAAALAAAALADRAALDAAGASAATVKAIQARLADKVGSVRASDLQPLLDLLAPVVAACCQAAEGPGASAPAPAAGAAGAAAAPPGAITSRAEALQALDAVCRFYESHEPANPAPLLIRRAQRLLDKSFVDILKDLAPESLAQVRTIAGLPQE